MSDLTSILTEHGLTFITDSEAGDGFICLCEVGDLDPTLMTQDEWAEHVAGVVRDTRTIRERLDLARMPDGAVILSPGGEIGVKRDWPLDLAVAYIGGAVKTNANIPLPALVLWHPEWDGSDV